MHLVVVDDSYFNLEAWSCLDGVRVSTFDGPEDLHVRLERDRDFLRGVSAVVLDYYFAESDGDGVMLGHELRAGGYSGPLYLSSESHPLSLDIPELFNRTLSKDCDVAWQQIREDLLV